MRIRKEAVGMNNWRWRSIGVSAICLLVMCVSIAESEVIVYDFPTLTGYLFGGKTESVTFDRQAGLVTSIRAQLVGVGYTGLMECYPCDDYMCDPDTLEWPNLVQPYVHKRGELVGGWLGEYHCSAPVDNFDVTISMRSWLHPQPFSLQPGDVLEFSVSAPSCAPGGQCEPLVDPYAVLTVVRFYVDVQNTVPASASTWGEIKALYRAEP